MTLDSEATILPMEFPRGSTFHRQSGPQLLRVLLISHTCQSPTEGQPKPERIAAMPGIDLVTLIPDRWYHNGAWRRAATVPNPVCKYIVGKVSLPWTGPGQFYLHWYPQLANLLREFRPHIIDLWEEPWALISAQAVRLRNRCLPDCRVICETEQNINRKLPFPFEQFRRYVLRHTDYAVSRNQEGAAVLRAKGYKGPATVVPNAVDADLFHPMNRQECQQRFGLSAFTVGYIGRFVERKGIQDLLTALAQCPPAVHAILVGSGEYEAKLRRQISDLRLNDRVRIISELPPRDLVPIMNAIDALVLPSRTVPTWKEQFGRVIIEAHACGTPVIGSNSGAIPEVVGEGGLIFPEGNAADLAACITRLANTPGLAPQLGATGQRQVHEHYTWKKVAERMYGIYQIVGQISRRESAGNPASKCIPAEGPS